jgi:hypothetical protein
MTTVAQLLGDLIEERQALINPTTPYMNFDERSQAVGRKKALDDVIMRLHLLEPEPTPLRLSVGVEYLLRDGHKAMVFAYGDEYGKEKGAGVYWSTYGTIGGTTWNMDGTFDPNQGETSLDIVGLWADRPQPPAYNVDPDGELSF